MIDLHIHSTYSDGEYGISQILEMLKNKNITTFSITDHDTVKAEKEVRKLIAGTDFIYINGIELSCIFNNIETHILGYDFDSNSSSFKHIVKLTNQLRQLRLLAILDYLKDNFDITFSKDEIARFKRIDNVGKPHIAKLLKAKGYAETSELAMKKYFKNFKSLTRIDAILGIKAINNAGGKSFLAHPGIILEDNDISYEELDKFVQILSENGLQGIEIYHSSHTKDQIEFFRKLAKKYKLLISGGSDFHGTVKLNADLGRLSKDSKFVPNYKELFINKKQK